MAKKLNSKIQIEGEYSPYWYVEGERVSGVFIGGEDIHGIIRDAIPSNFNGNIKITVEIEGE